MYRDGLSYSSYEDPSGLEHDVKTAKLRSVVAETKLTKWFETPLASWNRLWQCCRERPAPNGFECFCHS